jgi:hypothetical protein
LHQYRHTATPLGARDSQENLLAILAKTVLGDHPPDTRKKYEQIITELVHQRGITRHLETKKVTSPTSFQWLYQLRYVFLLPLSRATLITSTPTDIIYCPPSPAPPLFTTTPASPSL